MVFELDKKDIHIHAALAASMEMGTLQSVISSITSEYEGLSKSLEEVELSNHLVLLDIYSKELLDRLTIFNPNNKITLH